MSPYYVLDKVMAYWLNMVRNYREDAPSRRTVDTPQSSASRREGLNCVQNRATETICTAMKKREQKGC